MIGELEVLELEIMHKHGVSLKNISSHTGHSINTVRKYVRDGQAPGYTKRRNVGTKLDNYKAYLLSRISEARPNWLPATVLFMEIKKQGYTGGISTLRNYLQKLKPSIKVRPLIRFETSPGEQMQVDFANFQYKKQKYYAFVAVLGYSRLAFVKFVKNQQEDTLIACHEEAFDYFGGVPKSILYDNMKTVILKRDVYGKGKHKLHANFYDFSKHYGFIPRVCRPYSPQTKGKVERLISYVRYSYHNPFVAGRENITIDELNIDVMNWLNNIANNRVHSTTKEVPFARWDVEKQHLLNIPNNYTTNYGITNEASTGHINKHIMDQNTHPLQHDLSIYESILFAGGVA